jgi:hypothetical protein
LQQFLRRGGEMDEVGRNYLTLALNLERHFEGFVDAYFGPPELKTAAEAGEPRRLEILADDAHQLEVAIGQAEYDAQRKDFLLHQVRAMAAVIRNLRGDRLGFVEEVELYFDITPEWVDEAVFQTAHDELNGLVPGEGPLPERLAAWKRTRELEPTQIVPVFDRALQEARRRTLATIDLPAGEEVTLHLVAEQPWGAYNWYLGAYRSRIEINTDLPVRVDVAIPLMTHEAYPGHHTEHAIKEDRLYRQGERAEHAIQLLLAPECVISEGLANLAWRILFDEAQLASFLRDELLPLAGLQVDVDLFLRYRRAWKALSGVGDNAALLLHREGRPPDEVQSYLERYGLLTPKEAAQFMKFMQNPLFRSYGFNYGMGEVLLAPLLEGPEATANFRRLLSEPLTPSQVRQWLAEQEEASG